ncbi:MAG TPA: pilin [Candidatus Saccharimonadales bacterium]|jgi:hypothetical protein
MIILGKVRQVIRQSHRLRVIMLSSAVPAALLFTTAPAFAVAAPQPGGGGGSATSTARCAILYQGAVTCPSAISGNPKNKGTCWYNDPGNPDVPHAVDGFYKASSCSSDVFKNDLCIGVVSNQPKSCGVQAAQDPALTTCTPSKCDLVKKYINPLIAVLAGAVGLAATIGIVFGSIQYASSSGDPQKAAAAKGHIQNAVVALIGFFLLFALLSWLIPGGLLNGK